MPAFIEFCFPFDISPNLEMESRMEIVHETFCLTALPGVDPRESNVIYQTLVVPGYNPFWKESFRVPFKTREDAISFIFQYQDDKASKRVRESVLRLRLSDLKALATSTESQRWYALLSFKLQTYF